MGGYGSTWCAALSAAAASVGRRAYPGLFPQPWSATVAGALATTIRHGQPVVARSRWGMGRALCNAFLLARRAGPVTWLPAGGACPLAVLGTIEAALEFADQCDAHGGFPEAVVVPLGSGGTAAGLLIGMWIVGRPVSVCAVRVTDPWFATGRRVLSLVRRTLRLLRGAGCRVAPGAARLRVVTDQLGRGYGAATPAATAACAEMAREGLPLDMTYGSKAWAALPGCAASFRRVCFWHTFDPRLACPPAVDHPLLRTARGYAEMLWPLRKST
jgi:D-cysteine desulfhydrase